MYFVESCLLTEGSNLPLRATMAARSAGAVLQTIRSYQTGRDMRCQRRTRNRILIASNVETTTTLVKSALLSGALLAFAPGVVCAEKMAKKGTTPYVTHFIFRP
jgi:hypothetical protein